MATYYPIMLDVRGRRVLVLGGSSMVVDKARSLAEAGALVTVQALRFHTALQELADAQAVTLIEKAYESGDLAGFFLVVAHLKEQALIISVRQEALARSILLNVVDVPDACDFIYPSVLRRGKLAIAVSTEGSSPGLAKRIRQTLEETFPTAFDQYLQLAEHARFHLRAAGISYRQRDDFFGSFYSSDLLKHLEAGETEQAWQLISQLLQSYGVEVTPALFAQQSIPTRVETKQTPKAGTVALVGAGPGDPELITLKAIRALRSADVVLYDRLVHPAILKEVGPKTEIVFVGKSTGVHCLPQAEINRLLVHWARQNKFVVRLKGGDPFVFGRGGEEAETLIEAGIPFEIIPGISSAIAAPAYAGIPVTHREYASHTTIVTGHEGKSDRDNQVNWQKLAQIGGTLVILMGIAALEHIVEELRLGGLDEQTPVAIVERGTQAEQRTTLGTLATIVEDARCAEIRPPATIIVGAVAALHTQLSWFEQSRKEKISETTDSGTK